MAEIQKLKHVSRLIVVIAKQPTLLVLNAKIEAVRAGDIGKGYTVIIEVVRHLVGQTGGATKGV